MSMNPSITLTYGFAFPVVASELLELNERLGNPFDSELIAQDFDDPWELNDQVAAFVQERFPLLEGIISSGEATYGDPVTLAVYAESSTISFYGAEVFNYQNMELLPLPSEEELEQLEEARALFGGETLGWMLAVDYN